MTALAIRPMDRAGLALGVDWAAAEGWNPGRHDADAFHAADPGGFLLGTLDGEPVGMISAVRHGADFGFVGFYIVRPGFRGRGLGLALWRAGMARLEGRAVGLDGVVAQQANYRRSGFAYLHANARYEGSDLDRRADPAAVPLATVDAGALRAYDRRFFPAPRDAFLDAWTTRPGTVALGLVEGGALRGYGVIRPCRAGFKVGPLFADDPARARRLLAALAAAVPAGATVQLDVPVPNADAVTLARSQGMAPVFETARMVRGTAPVVEMAGQFGVTSFELGVGGTGSVSCQAATLYTRTIAEVLVCAPGPRIRHPRESGDPSPTWTLGPRDPRRTLGPGSPLARR